MSPSTTHYRNGGTVEQANLKTGNHEHGQITELSDDEKRVFRECRHESFWYRCVPLGGGLMAAVIYSTSSGYLKPHPKYGNVLRLLGAGLAGFVLGKISYWQQCQKKLLALPNSRLADYIRNRQRIAVPPIKGEPEPGSQIPDVYDRLSAPQRRSLDNIDMLGQDYDTHFSNHPNEPAGLDDSLRPSVDTNEMRTSTPVAIDEAANQRHLTTYDELRKKNRGEPATPSPNVAPQRDFSRRPWVQPQPLGDSKPPEMMPVSDEPKSKRKTNKYGDEMD